jgi:hypothetical protein
MAYPSSRVAKEKQVPPRALGPIRNDIAKRMIRKRIIPLRGWSFSLHSPCASLDCFGSANRDSSTRARVRSRVAQNDIGTFPTVEEIVEWQDGAPGEIRT